MQGAPSISTSRLNATQQQNDQHHQHSLHPQIQHQPSDFDRSGQDDFLDQMLHNFPSPWPDLPTNPNINKFFSVSRHNPIDNNRPFDSPRDPFSPPENDESSLLLAARFRQHQINGNSPGEISSSNLFSGGTSSPRFLVDRIGGSFTQGLYDHQQHLQLSQSHGAPATRMNQSPATGSTGGVAAPLRQKVRARRGQATDPHSIAERLRRERIAERMKSLQELVPNANKTDKASMLDEIIDYVKFLQIQVKVLSMSRLGGTAAVAPLVADISAEASRMRGNGNGTQTEPNDSLTVTEHQVAKLMDEDVGSAMQYLQGKGLCIMPISLATAIKSATCHYKNAPSSPSMSALTVQSALNNGVRETDVIRRSPIVKEVASVSKP